MPTKPKHYALFILNSDGSGVVKQFDTWQEAKAAYAAESATGKAVYLYPQPMKSIGAGSAPIEAPAKTPVVFTPQQNVGEFEWPTTPRLPRPTTAGSPFDDSYYDYQQWIGYCTLHPTHRECSIPGKPKFGTEVLVCQPDNATERSTDGTLWPSSRPTIKLADGMGGTFEAPPETDPWTPPEGVFQKWYAPCQYPNGFREYISFSALDVRELIFGTVGGSTVVPISRFALMRAERELAQYAGGVANVVKVEAGVLPRDINLSDVELEVNALREYVAGEPVFDTSFNNAAMGVPVLFPLKPTNDDNSELLETLNEPVSVVVTETGNSHLVGSRTANIYRSGFNTPSPNGPVNITWDEEAGLGTGYWDVTMASPTTLTFNFTPSGDTPADARPPEGWAGTVSRDGAGDPNGVDTTGVPPGGTHQSPWVYDYDAANILLESDFDNHYYTNGTGSYYAIAIPPTDCDPADTLVNENATEPITYDAGCGEWEIGTLTYNVYADGNCSFYDTTVGSSYNTGVIGTCNGNTYSVDSSGTVTSEPIISGYEGEEAYITIPTGASVLSGTRVRPQYASGGVGEWTPWNYTTSGTLLGSDASYYYYADGAGSYTSEPVTPPPCPSSGTDLGVDPMDNCNNIYADGMCGTYSNSNGSCDGPNCEDSALHTNGQQGWSYDGCYWSYDPYWDCTPSGTNLGVSADPCYDVYADGICGTYTSSNGSCDGPTCDSSGTDYGVDPNNYCQNIYADGSCGTYTSDNGSCNPPPCDQSGNFVNSSMDSIYTNVGCGDWYVGSVNWQEYTDGNCGTYKNYDTPSYNSSGSYLGECNGWNYYTDGMGGAYA